MNLDKKYTNSLKRVLKESKHFFCISHYKGDLKWTKYLNKSNYIIYNKSDKELPNPIKNIHIKNVGYNIYSYIDFIIKNYDNLPNSIVFCKDNIFTRHITIATFIKLLKSNIFTSLEEDYKNRNFPISIDFSDNSFNEINSSWYKFEYSRKYFSDYDDFYKFIFKNQSPPIFLRYSPGANYIVPKNHILLRSKVFYQNLLKFISHSQFSCESHFTERSLYLIWNSNIESSEKMNKYISKKELFILASKCKKKKKLESKLSEKISQKVTFLLGFLYFKLLLKSLRN